MCVHRSAVSDRRTAAGSACTGHVCRPLVRATCLRIRPLDYLFRQWRHGEDLTVYLSSDEPVTLVTYRGKLACASALRSLFSRATSQPTRSDCKRRDYASGYNPASNPDLGIVAFCLWTPRRCLLFSPPRGQLLVVTAANLSSRSSNAHGCARNAGRVNCPYCSPTSTSAPWSAWGSVWYGLPSTEIS